MSKFSELLPCPFCGSNNVSLEDAGYKTDVWFVQCNDCYATFPHFDSKEEAERAWNARVNKMNKTTKTICSITNKECSKCESGPCDYKRKEN